MNTIIDYKFDFLHNHLSQKYRYNIISRLHDVIFTHISLFFDDHVSHTCEQVGRS